MATELLNKEAYSVEPDNLVLAAQYPVLHRTIELTNPKTAIARGTAVVADADGACYVAGTVDDDEAAVGGGAVAIVSGDHAADTESDTVAVDAYVSGAFNAAKVTGTGDWDATGAAAVIAAQGNGIYLL